MARNPRPVRPGLAALLAAALLASATSGGAASPDFDGDGVIGAADFFALLRPCLGSDLAASPACGAADLDGDGTVGPADFFALFRPFMGPVDLPDLSELPFLACDGTTATATCAIEVGPELTLTTARRNLSVHPDGSGFEAAGAVFVETASGRIPLFNADLVFETGTGPLAGIERLVGSVDAPFPSLPLFGDAVLEGGTRASLGVDFGRNLDYLDAPLKADRQYLFFHFASGFSAEFGFDDILPLTAEPGATKPFVFSPLPDAGVTLVLNPFDPMFYVSSDLGSGFTEEDLDEIEQKRKAERDAAQSEPGGSDPNGTDPGGGDKPGSELGGIGFSWQGWLPFAPATTFGIGDDIGAFDGNILLQGTVPFAPLPIELTGETVVRTDPTAGVELAGNGLVEVAIPLLSDLIGFSIPLGDASAGMKVEAGEQYAYFSGVISPDTSWIPKEIPLVPQREVQMAGYLSDELLDFFVQATGEFGVGADFLGDLVGLDLSELQAQQAQLVIDKDGFYLAGKTRSAIHPAIGPAGEMQIEAFFPTEDATRAFIRITGGMAVAGVGLSGDAVAELSFRGLFVSGVFDTGFSQIALAGQITPSGPRLSGSASAEIRVETVTRVVEWVTNGAICGYNVVTDTAVCGFDTVVSGAICGYQVVTDAAVCGWDTVQQGWKTVTSAAICGTEVITNAAICGTTTVIDWVCKAACGLIGCDCSKVVAKSCRVAKSCSVPNYVDVPATCTDLSKPKSCTIPGTCQIEATCEQVVEIPELHGTVAADIALTLDFGGLRGDVSGRFNDLTLLGGTLRVGDPMKACIDVPPFGEMCAPF